MREDRIKDRVRKPTERSGAEEQPSRPRSHGWDQAVCSAAAFLNEGWILPETKCYPAAAEELAALLCAYGE